MKVFLFRLTLVVPLLAAPGLRAGEPPPASERIEITTDLLDRLVAEARGVNPALQAASAQVEAATAATAAVRMWEDPTASFGVAVPTARGFKRSEEGNLIYGVDEKLPLYGRPDLARAMASADAARAKYAADYEAQKLRRDLQVGLSNLAFAGRDAEVAKEDLGWLDATLSAVDHRYRVGQASQVDWLKIQTERARAGNDVETKERERDHSALALNRLLNRQLHVAWPQVELPSLAPELYYTPRLVEAALSAEPELKVMRQESMSARVAAEMTRKQRLPDVSVGVQARQYSGDWGLRDGMLTVSFSLPWLNKGRYDDDWRRDRARHRVSELAAADYELSVRELLHHHVVELDADRRQAVLYRDQLIPLTEQTLASAQIAWEHNLGLFQDILDTHRMLLADQLALAKAMADQQSLLAEIEFLTGSRDTDALVALASEPAADHEAPSIDSPTK